MRLPLAFAIAFLGVVTPAVAATITVETTADTVAADGLCSLREAVSAANANSGGTSGCEDGSGTAPDTIAVAPGTYALSRAGSDDTNAAGDLDVVNPGNAFANADVAFAGADDATTIVDAGGIDRVIDVRPDGVASSIGLTVQDLTVTGGSVSGAEDGGGVRMSDTNGLVTFRRATVSGNHAGDYGGGLDFEGSTNGNESIFIYDSEFTGNTAGDEGGGAYIETAGGSSPALVYRSTFSGNASEGSGGAIYLGASLGSDASLELVNSTISANASGSGGGAGIGLGTPVTQVYVYFSTIVGNTTTLAGGGAGIQTDSDTQRVFFHGAVLGGNLAAGVERNCGEVAPGDLTFVASASAYSVESADTCDLDTNTGNGNAIGAPTRLGPLAANGGETRTHALYDESPALNRVPNGATCQPNTEQNINVAGQLDQRGTSRPQGATCDAGAFEGSLGAIDSDGDLVPAYADNCLSVANPDQANVDGDAEGNACDVDDDGDGLSDGADNCPAVANAGQADSDRDGPGDACDPPADSDGDGVPDAADNCPAVANAGQSDGDRDGLGEPCDPDDDGDGAADGSDNCPAANPGQSDVDGDGLGDACDPDDDGDGIADRDDNCPATANPGQGNTFGGAAGDACELDPGPRLTRLRLRSGLITFTLSEAATVTVRVQRRDAGRRAGGECVRRTRANRSRPRCDLLLRAKIAVSRKAGVRSVPFTGRLGGRKLAPGRYRLVVTPTDVRGNAGAAKRFGFRIGD